MQGMWTGLLPLISSHLARKPVSAPRLSEWNLTVIDVPELKNGLGPLCPQYFQEKESKETSSSDENPMSKRVVWDADELVSKLEGLLRKLLQIDWRQNWVVYPIPCTKSMKTKMKWSKIVLYRVEAPLDLRI